MNKLIGLSIISLASLFMLAQGFGNTGYLSGGGGAVTSFGYGRNGIWEFLVFIIILIIVASIFDFGGRGGKGGGHGYGGGKGSGKKGGSGYDSGKDPWAEDWAEDWA